MAEGLVSPDLDLEHARAAMMWERVRTQRDARLRANARLALYAATVAVALHVPAYGLTWLMHLLR